MYVMMLGTLRSLDETRTAYDERYRFADIFATVDRAPERLVKKIGGYHGRGFRRNPDRRRRHAGHRGVGGTGVWIVSRSEN